MDSTTQRLMASAGGPVDPYFDNVTMLLHGDGTNGAQNNTFLDSSTNNFTITRNGNTTQGSFGPYGDRWSNYFDGNGDWLQLPSSSAFSIATSTTPFTIEAWVFPTAVGGAIFSEIYTGSGNPITVTVTMSDGSLVQNTNGSYIAFGWYSGSAWTTAAMSSKQVSLNTWNHVAVVFTGATSKIYVNGADVTKSSSPNPATSWGVTASNGDGYYIGRRWDTFADVYFSGYISNCRFVNGTAVYTAAFTPPAAPLTAITNTSLLTCQSNRFIDNSSNNFTITRNGDVSVRSFSPFAPSAAYSTSANGGSGYFDGTGDYLNTASSAAFNFGSGNFTVEMWFYAAALGRQHTLIDLRSASTNGWVFYINTSNQLQWYDGASSSSSTATISGNAWNHVAWTRSGTTLKAFLNGTEVISISNSRNNATNVPAYIGVSFDAANPTFGYISDARIVKGTAVYTAAFTPPTAPLTAVTNTSLLLNFTNGGVIDHAVDNVLETVGNAQISTSVRKYGTGSLAFDGTGDWLLAPTNIDQSFRTGDFTVEAWVWVDSTVNPGRPDNLKTVTVFSTGSASANDCSFAIYGNTTTPGIGLELYQASPAISLSVAATVATNSWVHVAWVRSGTTIYGFVGGTRYTLGTTSSAIGSSTSPKVGSANTTNYTNQFKGYIDDLRITKGIARYTAAFTPPSGPFPDM